MPNLDATVGKDEFARRLDRIMRARGLKPLAVARRIAGPQHGSGRNLQVYDWLRGNTRPRQEQLPRLAKILGVTPGILLGQHTLTWSGMPNGFLGGYCPECKTNYPLEGGRHRDEDLNRFQNMHWGIEEI
jgi:transcriptional regulator with XRE-family HTH domain